MKILRLRARGFIGLEKGLGLSEIDVDLSKLSGLVAITGKNGSGKTSFIELLSPYSSLFSRSPTFKNHVFLRDSFRTIDIEYEGSHYECIVKIDSQSGKSEGFIKRDGVSLTDGKISTYTQEIEKIFGSRTLFENSIFCAQNSKKISDLTTGQLKSLFSEFLQLDKFVEYESTSKQRISVIGTITSRIGKEIESLKDKIQDKSNVEQKLSEAEKQVVTLTEEYKQTAQQIECLKNDLDAVNDTISKSMVNKSKLDGLEKNLIGFKNDRDREMESVESELNRLRNKLREINDRLTECQKLLTDKDKIIEACNKEADAVEKLHAFEKEIEQRKKELDKTDYEINEITKTIDENRRVIDVGKKDPEIARLEAEISGKREKTIELKKRSPICPICPDTEEKNACGFITGALKAKKELPELGRKLSESLIVRDQKAEKANASMEECNAQLVSLNKKKEADSKNYDEVVREKHSLDEKLKGIRLLSVKKSDIAVAISQKDDLEKRKEETISEGIRIKNNRDKAIARIDDNVKKLNTEIKDLSESIDNTIGEKKEKIDQQIKSLSIKVKDIDTKITDEKESSAVLRQAMAERIVAEKELVIRKSEFDKYTHEQSEWIYMRNSCSKDGIQALEIDGVAPLINENTNKLLNMSFGPSYSVKLRTQTEEGREVLDIIIIDKNGNEALLDDMSGGEKCWILMCVRLAMTLISKIKSGKKFLTGFSDEIDGQLDVGKAIDFMKMYRSFMELGGFESFFFISHKPETISLSDHVITFSKGQIIID